MDTTALGQDETKLAQFDAEVICEIPNNKLNKFEGTLYWKNNRLYILKHCYIYYYAALTKPHYRNTILTQHLNYVFVSINGRSLFVQIHSYMADALYNYTHYKYIILILHFILFFFTQCSIPLNLADYWLKKPLFSVYTNLKPFQTLSRFGP